MRLRAWIDQKLPVTGFDFAGKSAARCKVAYDASPDWTAGLHDIFKNTVDRIFVKNAYVTVSVDVQFKGFKLKTFLVRHIVKSNRSKIRQPGFGANRGVFGNDDRNFVSLILVRKRFDIGQWRGNSAYGMSLVIA